MASDLIRITHLVCFGDKEKTYPLDLVCNHLYKYLHKCEDTCFILQKKYYLCIYKDSFGAKILWDDCAHLEMGKNYFTCSFLIFSIVSDNLRKKFLSIIKSWHWFSSCLSEREIWAYFLKWTRTQLPKMFLFCPFFMYGTMKKYSSSMYKDGGSLFQKNNECWKRLTLTSIQKVKQSP